MVLLVTHTASTWPKITQNSSWNCQWSRRFNSNTFNIFLISSVWKAFWNEIVQKSFVLALCIVFSCEFYSIEIKIDQYFHCILNYVMLSDFINILWCIFKFDQLDLACLFWSSETLWVFDWYISHQYFKNQEVVFKIQYHKILSPDFKIGQLYLINTTRNLAKNIYQMIEHKVCDSSTETPIRKDTPAQEGKQAGVLIGRSGLLENIKLPLSTQNSWLQDYHNPQLSNDFNKPSGLKINWTGNCFFKLPIQEFCNVWSQQILHVHVSHLRGKKSVL